MSRGDRRPTASGRPFPARPSPPRSSATEPDTHTANRRAGQCPINMFGGRSKVGWDGPTPRLPRARSRVRVYPTISHVNRSRVVLGLAKMATTAVPLQRDESALRGSARRIESCGRVSPTPLGWQHLVDADWRHRARKSSFTSPSPLLGLAHRIGCQHRRTSFDAAQRFSPSLSEVADSLRGCTILVPLATPQPAEWTGPP